mmetsp:Transcript_25847/g.43391  ORF Transcript_25847/g.43391 Transcript_25847/m.43391 type:complete len:814 (-) Transcript_25847:318-2759(-)
MLAVDQKLIEREIDKLTFYISPINRSNERRKQVVTFIQKILANTIGEGGCVVECGSSSLKSYLPDGDLDLVIFVPSNCNTNTSPGREDLKCLTAVFNTWCEEIADREEGKSQHHDMVIRNVEFVNARTKLAHCRINNIAVDVTINQIGALLTVTFLEEADRFIGMDHLFKRSLLVIKNWCQHESANYCGVPILGAKSGMLSSYAVSVIVLHIFNKYANLEHPFSVLRSFLFIFRNFPWDAQILTLDGSVPLSSAHSIGGNSYDSSSSAGSGSSSSSTGSTGVNTNIFRTIQQELSRHPALRAYRDAAMALHHGRFNAKSCNIQDPMDPLNNLGISVPRGNLKSIGQACQRGFHRLENLLTKHAAILQHHQQQQQQFQQHQQQQRQRADSNGVLEGNTSGGYNDFGNASNITHRTYNNDNNSHNNDNNNSNNVINNAVMYNVDENMVTAQHIHSASTVNVRQMLQPVPPVNLGYLGNPPPAGVAPPQQQHQPTSSNSNNNNNTNSSSSVSYAEPSEEVKGTVSPTGQQAGEMLPTAPEATGAGAVYVADDFNNINNNVPMDAGGEVSAASASAVPPTHHTSPAASVVMAAAAYSPLGETNTNNNDTNDDSNSNNVDKSPPYVRSAVIIGCGVAHTAWQIAIGETQRQAIYADPKWNGGDIDFCDGPDSGLSVARQIAMVSYRSALSYQLKFGRDTCDNTGNWQVRNYLEYQGKKFLDRFDALTYVRLTQIMDTHDVGRGRGGVQAALSAIRSKVLVMGIDSDVLYPVSEQQELSALIPTSTMKIIRTNNGHDGFLLEQQQVADGITSLLSSMEE